MIAKVVIGGVGASRGRCRWRVTRCAHISPLIIFRQPRNSAQHPRRARDPSIAAEKRRPLQISNRIFVGARGRRSTTTLAESSVIRFDGVDIAFDALPTPRQRYPVIFRHGPGQTQEFILHDGWAKFHEGCARSLIFKKSNYGAMTSAKSSKSRTDCR
jgi:hypothetical protein